VIELCQVQFVNPAGASAVTEGRTWNDRLQPTGITALTNGANLLGLGLYTCTHPATTCPTGNTGNLQTQTISLPGLSLTQNYTPDALNRLQSASEGTSSWYQAYKYTASGNRYIDPAEPTIFPSPTMRRQPVWLSTHRTS
jgi:hypothetical protein